ncbi:porin family protein [Niabella ginsengisoli]|uniref:PorT family protein n=1 Tax=Niabella ginsengisoli TaxID=522298 RepID=A0ABS9SG10_9BACT|nr:porin family protein [Niabella ginsengisoli]MCH5597265.1 PorT family protein [Niabella ginsengisoli]
MKVKQLLFGGLLFAAFSTVAIQSQAQVEIGVRAGLNLNNVSYKDGGGDKWDTKINPGFHAGVTFDIPVADEFYVQPGALFSVKGFKTTRSTDFLDYEGETRWNASYIEVPINFLYKPELGSGKLLLGAGPYVAYGIGGKAKFDDNISWEGGGASNSDEVKLQFVNDYNDGDDDKYSYAKPFDAGANLLVGYEFSNKFSAQLNAQLGLANIEPKDDGEKPDAKFRNVGFGVSLGYKF